MFASKFADPEAVQEINTPPSRRRAARNDTTPQRSGDAQTSKAEVTPTPHRRQDSKTSITPPLNPKSSLLATEGPSTPVKPIETADKSFAPPQPILDFDDSLPPLPHVAEIAQQSQLQQPKRIPESELPEPTIILGSSPTPVASPKKDSPRPAENLMADEAAESNINVAASTLDSAKVTTPEPAIHADSARPAPLPVKAKRSKRGRPCAVKLPSDHDKTYSGFKIPMSEDEVKARLEEFKVAGYDTRGYTHWNHEASDDSLNEPPQARQEYPDPTEQQQVRKDEKPAVSIPNKKHWDDYVNFLTEEKLRRLGVTTGDEPTPPPLSRKVSSPYPPLPFSPPLPGSSAASQQTWQNVMPFSAPFSPANSTNNTSIGGFMSPSPSLAQTPRPVPMAKQPSFGFAFPSGQTAPPQPAWSPQPFSAESPAITPDVQKQLPALPRDSSRTPMDKASPIAASLNQQNQQDVTKSESQAHGNANKTHATEEAITSPTSNTQYGDLASPRPQGHRHNISENLEREAEQYYPGEYVNEDRLRSQLKTGMPFLFPGPIQGQPSSTANERGGGRKDIEPSQGTHGPSQLNVAAKEFKYNPGNAHNRNFSMSQDLFMPVAPAKTAKAGDATSSVSLATAHSHQGSVSLSNLNVAAPEFKPPAQKNFAFSSSWFNFSKKPPTDALQPEDGSKTLVGSDKKIPASTGSKIFGNLADIIKPSKKSQAVPIIDPSDVGVARTLDASDHEDEDGRIQQSDTTRKKGRFDANGGDEIPRFAEPTPEPEQTPPSRVKNLSSPPFELKASPIAPSSPLADDTNLHSDQLDPEVDATGNTSDGSNVPWHGIEGEKESDSPAISKAQEFETLLASSPAASSDVEEAGPVEENHSSNNLPNSHQVEKENSDSVFPSPFKGAEDVMEYINDDNSDFGFDEDKLQKPLTPARNETVEPYSVKAEPPSINRGLFSPSPERVPRSIVGAFEEATSVGQPADRGLRASASPVRRLNKMSEAPVSDWDDMLSSGQELRIPQQSHVSDAHIAGLVEGILRRHLAPFEKTLQELGASIQRHNPVEVPRETRRPLSSYDKSQSDADDEDDLDEETTRRHQDARSDRRLSQIRSAVKEAMTSAQASGLGQIEQEVKFRKAAENRADDVQRLLTLSEQEIELYKEAAASANDKIQSLEHERDDALRRHQTVEEELRTKTLEFTAENAALESTLDEYRSSSSKWQEETEIVKQAREKLQLTIDILRKEAAENIKLREDMNERISKAETEISLSAKTLAVERSDRERTNEKHARDLNNLQYKLSEANKLKEKLGEEIDLLAEREKDGIRARVKLDETQNAKSKLEAILNRMTEKSIEHQTIVARYEREASEAHENTKLQVQRTKTLMQTDVEVAKKRVENIRADLGTRLEMTKKELENVRKDHNAVRERYERSLNEAVTARKEAMQEANAIHTTRLKEERERFDQALKDFSERHDRAIRNALQDKQRSEDSLHTQLELAHAKIANLGDKVKLTEERLSVAQSAAQAAVQAAQTAKAAIPPPPPPPPAPTAAAGTEAASGPAVPTRSIAIPSHLEKVSPQALRESIVVLQEQLQEREARIEKLEANQGDPAKLREKEAEVTWLREILGVRIDDLSDLVNSLQMEKFDRGAARNAAIRIKANLQMEQHDRDRQLGVERRPSPGPALPTLADIQNFASPKAATLAAAWGSFKKGPPSLAGFREAQNAGARSRQASAQPSGGARFSISNSAASARAPAAEGKGALKVTNPMAAAAAANANKPTEAQSFLSGLMTPPASNLRRSPSSSASGPNTARPRTPSRSMPRPGVASLSGSPEKKEPSTPPLLRKGDYDLDAELGNQELDFQEEDDEEEAETTTAHSSPAKRKDKTEETMERTKLEPLGEVVAAGES